MSFNNLGLFIMFNSKKEKLLCSWFDNLSEYYGQKVHYIGIANGLGGLNKMKSLGWFLRSDFVDDGITKFHKDKNTTRLNLLVKQGKVDVYYNKETEIYMPNIKNKIYNSEN